MEKLTVVMPICNLHLKIRDMILELDEELKKIGVESNILVVDDGSTDSTWYEIREIAEKSGNVFGIRLARSFGREAAIFAGLSQVNTSLCVVMDMEQGHPPSVIKDMLGVMERSGADVVEAVRIGNDGKGNVKGPVTGIIRRLAKSASGIDPLSTSDFRLVNRKVLHTLHRFGESTLSFRALTGWSGFTVFRHEYVIESEDDGENTTGHVNMRELAANAVGSVLSYTGKPLRAAFVFSLIFFLGALAEGIYLIVKLASGKDAGLSVLLLVILILGCFVLFSLGLMGIYISRIYSEVKRRPRHIIQDKTGGMFSKP